MRITGTKKLIIMLLSFICAIAVGIGLTYTFSPAEAAQETAVSTVQGGSVEQGDPSADARDDSEEEEYDERFDVAAMHALAEMLDFDYDLVNFYAHANNISVAEMEAAYYAELAAADDNLVSPDATTFTMTGAELEEEYEHEHDENGECILSDDELSNRITNFKKAYIKGDVVLDSSAENEDWFVSPDEAESYATTYFCGANTHQRVKLTSNIRGDITSSVVWTYSFPQVAAYGARYGANNTTTWNAAKAVEYNTYPSDGGWGQYTTLTLEPGEIITMGGMRYNAHYYWHGGGFTTGPAPIVYSGNSVDDNTYRYYTFDGDLATGGKIGAIYNTSNSQGTTNGHYYLKFRRSATGCTTTSQTYWSRVWWWEINIVRLEADRPTLASDDDGGTISGNTKTMYYDGTPAKISFYPDWGSCLLTWTASSPNVVIYDRALHGAECKKLTLQTTVAGTYTITLTTPTNRWADGSTGAVTFTFIVRISKTTKPTMKFESGVASNRKSKYVNDTGGGAIQTVTFENCDPAYLKWESNGLLEQSWDGTTLVLYQTLQNEYSISISIANPLACTWTDGTIGAQGFEFTIGPRLIGKMNIEGGSPGATAKSVLYNGEDQSLVLTPALRGSLNIVTAGLPYDYTEPEEVIGKLAFTTRDAARFTIIISPATGYVWDDQSTTAYTYVFTIETIKLQAPTLDEPTAVNGHKTVTYDPSGNYQTMKIQNVREEQVEVKSLMTVSPDVPWDGSTLLLTATSARDYYVTFEPKTNYEWAPGVHSPTFVLTINRYQLGTPYIIKNQYEIDNKQIEGDTKTVKYEDANDTKFLHLYIGYVGGVTVTDQMTVEGDGLTELWETDSLTLSGTEAKNYLIKITPTNNYMWKDGTFELKNFKLVISPILLDSIPMFQQNAAGAYEPTSGNLANFEYAANERRRIKIGNTDNENEHYDPSRMSYAFVNDAGAVISTTDIRLESSGSGELVFFAINAGLYRVRVQLNSTNYAWRDGSGVDLYFRLQITAQPIATPYLLKTECGGYRTDVYDTYMNGVYNGQIFTMSVAVKYAPGIVRPTLSQYLTQSSWAEAEEYGRLVVNGTETGIHTVRLTITDPNYRWEVDEPYYEFKLIIDAAEVSGVDFFADVVYESDGEVKHDGEVNLGGDGSRYSSTFITDVKQDIVIRRSSSEEFTTTDFQTQFTVRVTCPANPGREPGNDDIVFSGTEKVTISFLNAGTYHIYIGLTGNYNWVGGTSEERVCTFTIGPKNVDLPEIHNYGDGSVYTDQRSRNVTYNRDYQQLKIELGNDWKAFTVADFSDMEPDNSEAGNNKVFAYRAKSAGTHYLRIALADVYNYSWTAGTEYDFRLIIERLGVDVPEAFLKVAEGYDTARTDGTAINPDVEHGLQRSYTGTAYFVYLFGEVIEKTTLDNVDVIIDVQTATSNGVTSNMATKQISVNDAPVAWELSVSKVNVYDVVVSFPAGTNNLYWNGTSEDDSPRTFTLEIIKKVVSVPVIKGEESQTLQNDTLSRSFVYDNDTHRQIEIDGYLPLYGLMTLTYDHSLLRSTYNNLTSYLEVTTDVGQGGNTTAYVSRQYLITISLDYVNERWDVDDTNTLGNGSGTDKNYYIVITKRPVTAPAVTGSDAGDDFTKTVTYNGNRWVNGLEITGLNSDWMTYTIATPSTMEGSLSGTTLTVSTAADANTYTVVVSLRDPSNLCWDHDNSSGDLNLSLVVDPFTFATPTVFVDGDATDISLPAFAQFTSTTKTVTYNDGNTYYICIENYLDSTQPFYDQMSVEVVSAARFKDVTYDAAHSHDSATYKHLIYSATNAATYTVRFTLSQNAIWDTGSSAPVDISLIIEKKQYDTPFIIPADYNTDPSTDTTINGFTKTVTYALDSSFNAVVYNFDIGKYDDTLMEFYDRTVVGSTEQITPGTPTTHAADSTVYYPFTASKAGTYTVTFRLLDFENNRWAYADVETVTFTLVINKLTVIRPTIDRTLVLNGDTVNGAGNTLTVTYDTRTHALLLPGIRDDHYMTYTANDNNLVYDAAPVATNFVNGTDNTAGYLKTAAQIFGYDNTYTLVGGADPTTVNPDSENYVTMKAKDTGTYKLTFDLVDYSNMKWSDGNDANPRDITLLINKVSRAAPYVPGGTVSKPYTGQKVQFTITNAFNGCFSLAEFTANTPSGFATETLTLVRTTATAGTGKIEDLMKVASWYNGTITLEAVEVGTYTVTVSLADTKTTSWNNNANQSVTFNFTIAKREVRADIRFNATNPANVTSNNVTNWAVNDRGVASITLTNIAGRDDDNDGVYTIDLNTLGVQVYFVYRNTTTELTDRVNVPTATLAAATITPQPNNLFNVTFTYDFPYGEGNIEKANYTLIVVQRGESGNYTFTTARKNFSIGANPAPFNRSNLVWQYVIDNDATQTVHTVSYSDWSATSTSNYYRLPYLTDGGKYQFSLYMDATGMAGYNGDGPHTEVENALVSWKVQLDRYEGDRNAAYVNKYRVRVVIKAADPDTYAYNTTTFNFYYEITPALYDITGLTWDYNPSTPFTFDGNAHSVNLTGTFPTGLSVKTYTVSGFDLNSQVYAGTYNTSLQFASSNKNYVVPDLSNSATYIHTGTFPGTCSWVINKAYLDVTWSTKQSSDGTSIAYVPVLAAHGEKVDYTYEIKDTSVVGGWRDTGNDFTHTGLQDYRVTATLKSNPSNPAIDYDRNYILRFPNPATDNPYEFTLGNNAGGIGVTVDVHSTTISTSSASPTVFQYDGTDFEATVNIFMAPSSAITTSNILVTYYSTVNDKKPIGIPTEAGSYVVKLTLIGMPNDGVEYALSDSAFYFKVEKGDLDDTKIYWQYTHTDGNGDTVTAIWDVPQGKWLNNVTGSADFGSPVTFTYDGYGHTVELISEDPNLTVTTQNRSYIHAGSYTSRALLSFDSNRWNNPTVATQMPWVIEKAVLDLSFIQWDYSGNFEYTLSAGVAKKYSVKLDDTNVPVYLLDYISYTTVDALGDDVDNSVSDAGDYYTTCNIATLPADSDYVVGAWPTAIPTTLSWTIDQKKIELPASSGAWTEFDGTQHDLLAAITLDLDWKEYFTIEVEYGGNPYDGTTDYGYKYTAFNAGNYTYKLSLNEGINDDNENVVWDDGSLTYTTDDQSVTIAIGKAVIIVSSWNTNAENSTVDISGSYVTAWGDAATRKFIGYKFYEGADLTGTQVSLDYVLNKENTQFSITAFVKEQYGDNVTLDYVTMSASEWVTFTTWDLSGVPDDDNVGVGGKPYIKGYTTSDSSFYEFTVEDWKTFLGIDDDYWKAYLEDHREQLEKRRDGETAESPEVPEAYADEAADEEQELTEEDWGLLLYAYELLSQAKVYITYNGTPVTFVVNNWDEYYVDYLTVWGGDSLSQSEAGSYSITYTLIKNATNPLYWSRKVVSAEGVTPLVYEYDRSSVTLNFEIRYRMLDLPELSEEITFTGNEIDVIEQSYAENPDELAALIASYGDYVEYEGRTAVDADTYVLYLKIKPEYTGTVRWNNGSAFGQPGTYEMEWKILPIYIYKPVPNPTAVIEYNGGEHSVFESLQGYTDGENGAMSEELQQLLQYARIPGEGSRGINAGNYTASFILPDSNYAWTDITGGRDETHTSLTVDWTISKKPLDLSNLSWTYDEENPFKYTFKNGEEATFTLKLEGLPLELTDYVSYLTYVGDVSSAGNTASKVGTYRTVLYLFENDAQLIANYELGSINEEFYNKYKSSTGYLEITWKIVQRTITVPENAQWTLDKGFDGDVHDIMVMLGFDEDWANYYDVTVSYIGKGDLTPNYDPEKDPKVEYSIYNVYYVGEYSLTINIKAEVNAGGNNVVWLIGGNENTGEQHATLNYNVTEINVSGWTDDLHLSKIISTDYDELSDFTKDMFELVVYDYDVYVATGKIVPLTAEQIESNGTGFNYCILFRLRAEYDTEVIKQSIVIKFATGVDNPFMFGNYDFGTQPIVWLPLPTLENDTQKFTAEELTFKIADWDTTYVVEPSFITAFNAAGYTNTDGSVTFSLDPSLASYVYSISDTKLLTDGTIKVKAAGEYKVTLRFAPDINLSWYDPDVYEVNGLGELVYKTSGIALTDAEINGDPANNIKGVIDRYAKTLKFTVTKASLRPVDVTDLYAELEYNGSTLDITSRGQIANFIENLKLNPNYGSLITIDGNTGKDAKEYTLYIMLTDPNSSYWDLGETTYDEVISDEYKLMWVQEGGNWVVKFVRVDGDGQIVLGADGKYQEYNNGEYFTQNPGNSSEGVQYKLEYRVGEYVRLFDSLGTDESGNKISPDADGTQAYAVLEDGKYVLKSFTVADGKIAVGENGNYGGTEVEYSYVFASDDGVTTRYKLAETEARAATYEVDANGDYLGLLRLDTDGNPMSFGPLMEDGHYVIDYVNSKVFVENRKVGYDPIPVKWKIVPRSLNTPVINEEVKIVFTGTTITLTETGALTGFDGSIMEVTENGSCFDAGTYEAVIKLTSSNYYWADNPDLDYVTVVWTIEKGSLDLSKVSWKYSWKTDENSPEFPEYMRKDGKAQTYWVELDGIPEELKENVLYTTNGKTGAYAGRNAGKYVTGFEFININEENYEEIIWPEVGPVTWYINKKKLDMPDVKQTWMVFDDGVHNLLNMLNLFEGWEEYCDVTVAYASNYLVYMPYDGYDEGDGKKWYLAHGAGAYRFTVSIKSEINTNPENPSVVWLKSSG
ncbi:MAG: hypothetical protein NC489_23470, partial [Ruminococcus flavefaciens]|nr:hypothetical protein [Ruminococcus flavefaciens]